MMKYKLSSTNKETGRIWGNDEQQGRINNENKFV